MDRTIRERIRADMEAPAAGEVAMLRRLSGAEKRRTAAGMFEHARRLVLARLRSDHPHWDEEALHAEWLRRLGYGPDIIAELRRRGLSAPSR